MKNRIQAKDLVSASRQGHRSLFRVFLAMMFVAGLSTTSATAQDAHWPQFRGPDFNPVSNNKNLPSKWSATENVEWSTEIKGRGWSSPVVAGDKIFITSVVTEGDSKKPQVGVDFSNDYVAELTKKGLSQEEVTKKVLGRDIELPEEVSLRYNLICVNLKSGKPIWEKEFFAGRPPVGRHRKNSFCSESVVTDGKHLFVYITSLGLFCYDLDGNQVWKKDLKKYPVYLNFGTGSSPILVEDQVIITNDNEETSLIASYNKTDGKLLWEKKDLIPADFPKGMPKSGWVTPFLWKNDKRTEIVTIRSGIAISFDLKGNILWKMKGMRPGTAASSFAAEGLLYVNTGRGGAMVAMKPGAEGEFSVPKSKDEKPHESLSWVERRAGTYIPTAVAYDGGLYVLADKGIIARRELDTGDLTYKKRIKPVKKEGKPGRADFTSSPWAYGGRVYCLSEQGDTYVLTAEDDYELQHVNSLGDMCLATPAIVGDRLIIRTEKKLYSIRNKK